MERKTIKKQQVGNFIAEFFKEDEVPYMELRTTELTWAVRVTPDHPLYVLFSELEWSDAPDNLPQVILLNLYTCSSIWDACYHSDLLEAAKNLMERKAKDITDAVIATDDERDLEVVRAKMMFKHMTE